jgi:DNA-binding SARP family transcriptional activator
MDASEVLPTLDIPTLVIHRTGDRAVPVAYGRAVAAAIRGARLLEQPGDDHFAYAGEVDPWMEEFERFVTGRVRARPVPRRHRPAVRITTLGRFAVEVDGEEVTTATWGSRRSRQLCKRLVAARGWPVTRDELFDLLWPEEADRRRLGARLSVQLSTVRRVLGGGVIADRESVRLDLDEVDTDLEALYRATDDEEIVAAHTGEFLPDDRYEAWTDATRAEVRTRVLLATRRLARHALDGDEPDRAIALAHQLIDLDQHDDEGHHLLIAALLRTGAHGEARRAHDTWRMTMREVDVDVPAFEDITGA